MQKIAAVVLLVFFITTMAWAQDKPLEIEEVVVTATKIEEPVEETTSSVVVVSKEEIELENTEFVVDVLENIPELNVVQNGGTGTLAQVFLRGSGPSQLMVMIDGIKVKSTTTGTFDFSGINIDDIERIEIVKGPQSTIYGSEAQAGVINIITKRGRGEPETEFLLEGGSFGTYRGSATFSGAFERFDYRVTASYFNSDGISIAEDGDEKDGYRNTSFSAKIGINPSEALRIELNGRYYTDRTELDDFDYFSGQVIDAPHYIQRGEHLLFSAKTDLFLFDRWQQVLTASAIKDTLNVSDRDNQWNNYDIITAMDTIDWQNNIYLTDNYTITAGVEYRVESGENRGNFNESTDNTALYLNNRLKLFDESLVLNAGARIDDNEAFGDHTTYRVGAIYNYKNAGLRIRTSYGTGFSAPTFNQLYFPFYGNPDLKPEESRAWEAGIEKDLMGKRLTVSITYFDQDYENLIQTDPDTWTAQNIGEAEVKGVELGGTMRVTEYLTISTFYTHLDTEDKDTGERLTRRPDDKLNITLRCSRGKVGGVLSYTYVGDAYDASAGRELDSYSLVNLSGGYRIMDNIELFARIDNLLDEDYETAAGYNTPGISAFAGVKVRM
jgi:vitamin B12 transporter